MNKYVAPKMEVVELAKYDVIMASGVVTPGNSGTTGTPSDED